MHHSAPTFLFLLFLSFFALFCILFIVVFWFTLKPSWCSLLAVGRKSDQNESWTPIRILLFSDGIRKPVDISAFRKAVCTVGPKHATWKGTVLMLDLFKGTWKYFCIWYHFSKLWNVTGHWNLSSWKTQTRLSSTVDIIPCKKKLRCYFAAN